MADDLITTSDWRDRTDNNGVEREFNNEAMNILDNWGSRYDIFMENPLLLLNGERQEHDSHVEFVRVVLKKWKKFEELYPRTSLQYDSNTLLITVRGLDNTKHLRQTVFVKVDRSVKILADLTLFEHEDDGPMFDQIRNGSEKEFADEAQIILKYLEQFQLEKIFKENPMLMFNDEKKEPHEYFSNLKRVLGRWNIRGDDYTGTFLQPTQDTLIVTYRGLKITDRLRETVFIKSGGKLKILADLTSTEPDDEKMEIES